MEPWVEKYRPSSFDTIVLEETNQLFFKNMLKIIIFQIYCFTDLPVLEKRLPF